MIFHNVAHNSADWYALRRGIPTASCMDQIVSSSRSWYVLDANGDDVSRHARQDTAERALTAWKKKTGETSAGSVASRFDASAQQERYISLLLAEWATGATIEKYQSREMDRGLELEPEARAWYEMRHDCDTADGGFITRDDGRIGCSPDFVVWDGETLAGGGEIKCPQADTHMHYARGLASVKAVYQHQIQGCLLITGAAWWDTVSYFPHPRMRPVVERVYPSTDQEYRSALSAALDLFVAKLDDERERMAGLGFGPQEGRG